MKTKGHKTPKKSTLAKQAEKLFSSYQNPGIAGIPETYLPYRNDAPAPVIVQTFTTYSVCEDPIPALPKR